MPGERSAVAPRIDELAIFGGPPSFSQPLHVGRPNIGDRDRLHERIANIIESRWLTNEGPYVRELESRLEDMLGVAHCVATSNATTALGLVVRALGMTGEVLVPSFTFIATPHALSWVGARPVFVDIDRRSHTVDPAAVEAAVTPRTRGIVGVHTWGLACDVEALTHIARAHQLKLVFDAAHALGCTYRGRMIGGFGDAEVFSFHATKIVNSFEGGAVTTNDPILAKRLRRMRNFGFVDYDAVAEEIGTNGKMSEAAAAMGLTSLESFDEFVLANKRNHALCRQELAGVEGLALLCPDEREVWNDHYLVIEVDGAAVAPLTRDDLIDVLRAENVLARRYFYPGCHLMAPYRDQAQRLPVTEGVAQRVLILPTGTAVSEDDVARVCGILRVVVAHASEVRRRSAARGRAP